MNLITTSSKFILILRKASEKSIDMNCGILKTEYDRFVKLVLSGKKSIGNLMDYYDALLLTDAELDSLAKFQNFCFRAKDSVEFTDRYGQNSANPYLSSAILYFSKNIPLLLQHVVIGVIN